MKSNTFSNQMMNSMKLLLTAAGIAAVLSLQGCGGSGAGAAGTGSGSGATGSSLTDSAASVSVTSDKANLSSDGQPSALMTVFVKDSSNRALPNTSVSVQTTDSGSILQVTDAKTGANGSMTFTLISNSKVNRTIPVTVSVGSLRASIDIPVGGTTATLSGPQSLAVSGQGDYVAVIKDAAGVAVANSEVALTSSAGNTITPAKIKTDSNGQAAFKVATTKTGNDVLTVSGAGAQAALVVLVASNQLTLSGVTPLEEVLVSTNKPITVQLKVSGTPTDGQILYLSSTRGSVPSQVTTSGGGFATFNVVSNFSGQSTISVLGPGGTLASTNIEFVSKTASAITLQASSRVVAANPTGTSGNSTQLVASVKDSSGNPVKGVSVNFSAVKDPSGGRIEPGTATTDSAGNAAVAFIAGPTVTGSGQVEVKASLAAGSSTSSSDFLTVAGRQISIVLGTGNKIEIDDGSNNTRYKLAWNALVVDSASAPVPNAKVTAEIVPIGYFKGRWLNPLSLTVGAWASDINGATILVTNPLNPTGDLIPLVVDAQYCPSEDSISRDGLLQTGEDQNGNNQLEPGLVATTSIPSTGLVTQANGYVDFKVVYAKSYANFAVVRLDVKALVAGTESTSSATFVLGFANENRADAPPTLNGGFEGPFGSIVSPQLVNGVLLQPCQNPR
jgi:hypothetical protein